MKMIVCFDGSDNSEHALSEALRLFGCLKPFIVLLEVIEESRDASSEAEEAYARWHKVRSEALKLKAKELVAQGFEVDAVLADGDPREMILEATRSKKPDILVLGKRGGGHLPEMLIGSVSTYLVRHAACPVLVIHAGG